MIENDLIDVVDSLIEITNEHKNKQLNYQMDVLKWLSEELKRGITIDHFDLRKLKEELFPRIGGLTDFYIWDHEFKNRKEVNLLLEDLKDRLWEALNDKH